MSNREIGGKDLSLNSNSDNNSNTKLKFNSAVRLSAVLLANATKIDPE